MVYALAGLLKFVEWGLDYLPGSARVVCRKEPVQQEGWLQWEIVCCCVAHARC